MALQLSVDLTDATFGDLVALVNAAQVSGVESVARVELEGSTLMIKAVAPTVGAAGVGAQPHPQPAPSSADPVDPVGSSRLYNTGRGSDDDFTVLPALGESAIRSVIDILTGRQEPPR